MAQPQKKAPIKKKATISDLKSKMGFGVTVEKGSIQGASNADKPMDWILLPKAFQDAIKLPGFPQGSVSTMCGHSRPFNARDVAIYCLKPPLNDSNYKE